MKFNYSKAIEDLGGDMYYEDKQYVFATFKGFRFKVYKQLLRTSLFSFEGNFRACVDSVDYFKQYMDWNCKHSNLVFSVPVFKGMREKVSVTCKEHGLFETTPEQLINRSSGCVKCYNKYEKPKVKNKGLEKFVEEANIRFNSVFDYSKTVYKNTMTKEERGQSQPEVFPSKRDWAKYLHPCNKVETCKDHPSDLIFLVHISPEL